MFDKDYLNRINIQKICGFILNGLGNICQEGTPIDREKRNSKALLQGLRIFRDRVLNTDWEAVKQLSPNEMDMKTEELYQEVLEEIWNQEGLFFEMGFRAGLKFAAELFCQ